MNRRLTITLTLAALLAGCGDNRADPNQLGADPQLPEQEHGLVPSMNIADPAEWGSQRPIVPQG